MRAAPFKTYLPLPAFASVILSRALETVMGYLCLAMTFYMFGVLTCAGGVAVLVQAAEDEALHDLRNQ